MKVGLFPAAALFAGLAVLLASRALGLAVPWWAIGAVGIVGLLAVALEPLLRRRPRRQPVFDASLSMAMPEWRAGRRSALEGMVAEFAGPAATAHGLRCAALADMLAEQLALLPEESADVSLAALLHVLPAAFPDDEDATFAGCEFSLSAITSASAVLERSAPRSVATIAGEAGERWDGSGRPNRLTGEAISTGGRILAAACAFDHASTGSLESGLELVRRESSTGFDPVVAAELVHLFREPWQRQVAA